MPLVCICISIVQVIVNIYLLVSLLKLEPPSSKHIEIPILVITKTEEESTEEIEPEGR